MSVSRQRKRETIDALRAGTVPQRGLDLLAVGMERFSTTVDAELESVKAGSAFSKLFEASTGAGRPSLPGGFKSVPSGLATLSQRSRSVRPRLRCID